MKKQHYIILAAVLVGAFLLYRYMRKPAGEPSSSQQSGASNSRPIGRANGASKSEADQVDLTTANMVIPVMTRTVSSQPSQQSGVIAQTGTKQTSQNTSTVVMAPISMVGTGDL